MRYNLVLMTRLQDPRVVIGRAPERLTPGERAALEGKYVAFEIYTPKNLARRIIEAIGDSVAECARQLKERGLDPAAFEFDRLGSPY